VPSDIHHFLVALDGELERKLERLDHITFVLERGIGQAWLYLLVKLLQRGNLLNLAASAER
jgi:hypothetical protein